MFTQSDARTSRCLGAAFVFQFATSLAAGLLTMSILTGGIPEVLLNTSSNLGQVRASILFELLTSVGIIIMTSLLYIVLRDQNRAVALVALGLWMAEAVMLAVKTLGLYALLDLSQGVDAGSPVSYGDPLGTLVVGISQHAADIAMLFFCLGALLWYALLFQSRIVPRPLSGWAMVAVPLVLVATVLVVWDHNLNPSLVLYALYVPFELVLGLWLLVKGAHIPPTPLDAASAPDVLRGKPKTVGKAGEHHPTS